MIKRYLPFCLIAGLVCGGAAFAQKASSTQPSPAAGKAQTDSVAVTTEKAKTESASAPSNPVLLANQMMIVFMERMKAGNFKEAREVAEEMIFGHDKYADSAIKEYKSFHSIMEKELYELQQKRAGSKKNVVWVDQPISDGFYLLSVLDFQEGKHEDALKNMSQAIFWNPTRSAFHTERGFMLIRKNSGPDLLMANVAYIKAIELADNNEDFAAALRGMAFVLVERNQLDVAYGALLIARHLEPDNTAALEEMSFIKSRAPGLSDQIDVKTARALLKKNNIPIQFSEDHVQVLIKLADSFTEPNDVEKAVLLLKKAQEMSPKNQEVARRLKILQKK